MLKYGSHELPLLLRDNYYQGTPRPVNAHVNSFEQWTV